MPRISDDLYMGNANGPSLGFSTDGNPAPMESGVGPMGRNFTYDIVPLTLQVAGLASSQNPGSGASFTLTAGTGVTAVVDAQGVTRYVLDVPRCVTLTAAGANTATYRVAGYDAFGQLMTANLAAPSTSTVATTKAFKSIISITNINATAGTNGITAGFNDKFGLPVVVNDAGYIVKAGWAGVLAQDAGTFVAADATSPATALTTDVRGCYTPSSASNGARRLVFTVAMPATAVGPNSTRAGAFGQPQV